MIRGYLGNTDMATSLKSSSSCKTHTADQTVTRHTLPQSSSAASCYLRQRPTELMDGVHDVQQHVVTHHQFTLRLTHTHTHTHVRMAHIRIIRVCVRGILTDLEMALITLEKPTASFSSSCNTHSVSHATFIQRSCD